jgi:hypothetical protein
MAVRPEILAQLARMLGDDALRSASDAGIQAAAETHFDTLVDALVAETADSDDVYDHDSAVRYVELRLTELAIVLEQSLIEQLKASLEARLTAW